MKFTEDEKKLVIAKLEHSLSHIDVNVLNILDVQAANGTVRLFISMKDSEAEWRVRALCDPNHDWSKYKNQLKEQKA